MSFMFALEFVVVDFVVDAVADVDAEFVVD